MASRVNRRVAGVVAAALLSAVAVHGVDAGSATAGGQHTRTWRSATPLHLVSLPDLIAHEYDGHDLRIGRVIERTDAFVSHVISYRSGGLDISGTIHIPRHIPGETGPFPVLVLAHGFADVTTYGNGDGFMREQEFLARRGYVVLHTDYRDTHYPTPTPTPTPRPTPVAACPADIPRTWSTPFSPSRERACRSSTASASAYSVVRWVAGSPSRRWPPSRDSSTPPSSTYR